jgi:LmbE family N-acetylglucosaminyl deacetylase
MVVVAHADDAEWGCSGTVARWCAEGWEVVYVLCTDGSKGSDDPEITSEELVKIRQQEQLNAGKVLGLHNVVFLGYEDSLLQPTLDLRRDIAREIRRYRPDVLICMGPTRRFTGNGYIGHPDHFASGEAALSAVFPTARDRLTFPELLQEGLEPHKVREVWIMEHDNADQYVDVTDYIETSIAALQQHKSQVTAEEADKYMRQWRSRVGEKVGFKYAEGFKRFKLD